MIDSVFVRLVRAVPSHEEHTTMPFVVCRGGGIETPLEFPSFESMETFSAKAYASKGDQLYVSKKRIENTEWNPLDWDLLDVFEYVVWDYDPDRLYYPGELVLKEGQLSLFVENETDQGKRTYDWQDVKPGDYLTKFHGYLNYSTCGFKRFEYAGRLMSLSEGTE